MIVINFEKGTKSYFQCQLLSKRIGFTLCAQKIMICGIMISFLHSIVLKKLVISYFPKLVSFI